MGTRNSGKMLRKVINQRSASCAHRTACSYCTQPNVTMRVRTETLAQIHDVRVLCKKNIIMNPTSRHFHSYKRALSTTPSFSSSTDLMTQSRSLQQLTSLSHMHPASSSQLRNRHLVPKMHVALGAPLMSRVFNSITSQRKMKTHCVNQLILVRSLFQDSRRDPTCTICVNDGHQSAMLSAVLPYRQMLRVRHYGYCSAVLSTAMQQGQRSCTRYHSTFTNEEDPADPSSQAFCDYLANFVSEYEAMVKDGTRKTRELEMRYTVDCIKALNGKKEELKEVQILIQGGDSKEDREMQELAEEEVKVCNDAILELQEEIVSLLTPPDQTDDHDILLELSAGVGGQEAMLFTGDMFHMYENYAAYKGWKFRVVEYHTTDIGGVRGAVVSIGGHQVNRYMKYEGGVHRVQRVPKTERSGRMHTSTMTVAILPQPKKIEIKIDKKDLRIETFKASGAGGQHVNTTDSAVRIVHLPTGVSVECQQDRSQIRNRQLAMEILQVRLYNLTLKRHIKNERSLRKEQIGLAERSDKIRTYNFRDNRITDHRAGLTVHNLDGFLEGEEDLDDMIESLIEMDQKMRLRDLIEEFRESKSGMVFN